MHSKKDFYIKTRIPSKLKQLFNQKAEDMGISMSAYLRYLVVKDLAETRNKTQFYLIDNLKEILEEMNKLNLKRSFMSGRFGH